MSAPDFLTVSDGTRLAYKKQEGAGPTIIWCGGLKSDMEGSKAVYLDNWAKENRHAYIRFDYFGHGKSEGDFVEGTISRWSSDIVSIIDNFCKDGAILVGSSMGGWASLLAAMARKNKIKAMVLINPAPDFTEKLIRAHWSEEQERALEKDGVVYEPSDYDEPYVYSQKLMEDGKARQILDHPISLNCPIHILQGAEDSVVPPDHSRLIVDAVTSQKVAYSLVKGGDHSLSRETDLKLLSTVLHSFLAC